MDKVRLFSASLNFFQNGNTLGTTSEVEELTINLEGSDIESGDFFYTIKTPTGWSIDDPNEFIKLIDRVKQILTI